MKILGIGVDLIKNKRIAVLVKNKNFIFRTFGSKEISFSKNLVNKNNYFAKRFAAKEAFSKSLGTGFRNGLSFKDISITNDNLGKPSFSLSNKLNDYIKKRFKLKKFIFLLSITDEKKYSLAFVIFQKI